MLPSHYPEFFEAVLLGVIVAWLLLLYGRTKIKALGFLAGYLAVPCIPPLLQAYVGGDALLVESGKTVVVIGHFIFTGLLIWATAPDLKSKKTKSKQAPAEEVEAALPEVSGAHLARNVRGAPVNHVEEVRKLLNEVKANGQ